MSRIAARPWALDEFFRWQEEQESRYELVGGFPLKMMTGASNAHDDIVVNLIALLKERLRGSACRPFTADGSVETLSGQIRRPDVGVDCGRRDPDGYAADRPTVLFEVLSPSTRDFDRFRKIDEYKAVATVMHIVFVEPSEPLSVVWSRRDDGGWKEIQLAGLDAMIDLTAIAVQLPLREIYDGIAFEARTG